MNMGEISPAAYFVASVIASVVMLLLGGKHVNGKLKASTEQVQSNEDLLTTLQESNDHLNTAYESLKGELVEVRDQRDKANMTIGSIQQQAKEDLDRLQLQIKGLQKDIDDLKLLNIEAKTKAENIAKERDEQLRETAKIAKELADERKITSDLSRQIDGLKLEIIDLKQQLAVNRTTEMIVAGIAEKLTASIAEAIRVKQSEQGSAAA